MNASDAENRLRRPRNVAAATRTLIRQHPKESVVCHSRHTQDFCRSLGHLLRSKTPLSEALTVLIQTAHPTIRVALTHLQNTLPNVDNFATAAAGLMPPETLAIVGAFERRGHLGAGLEAVALGLEGRGFVRRRFLFVMA